MCSRRRRFPASCRRSASRMGWAWTYLVVAELVAASSGLGYISLKAMRGFEVDTIFLAIAIIGVLGILTDQVFRFLRLHLASWASERQGARQRERPLGCRRRAGEAPRPRRRLALRDTRRRTVSRSTASASTCRTRSSPSLSARRAAASRACSTSSPVSSTRPTARS